MNNPMISHAYNENVRYIKQAANANMLDQVHHPEQSPTE